MSNKDLTGTYGQMIFVNGVAPSPSGMERASRRTICLPAPTYTVVEKEANQDGYTTTAVGETGAITAAAVYLCGIHQ